MPLTVREQLGHVLGITARALAHAEALHFETTPGTPQWWTTWSALTDAKATHYRAHKAYTEEITTQLRGGSRCTPYSTPNR
jgi:hypothetical protein